MGELKGEEELGTQENLTAESAGAESGDDSETADAAVPAEVQAGESAGNRLESIIESLLFASGSPLALRRLSEVLNGPTVREIKQAIEALTRRYEEHGHGLRIVAVAGGYQFRTPPENAQWVRALLRERPVRLGRAAMETLAVVAYKQPVTRAEIEAVRGVDADSALSTLMARRLIRIAGRKEAVGRPLLYATTPDFLEAFGLKDLNELPALKEIGPVSETDDETATEEIEYTDGAGTVAEDPQPSGDQLAEAGGGADPRGPGTGERPGGDGAGDAGESGE